MSDDSFIREVNEELRHDRARAIWTRFGKWLIAGAVLVIAVTAGFVAWERYRESSANASGDAYSAALALAEETKYDEALAALDALAADGYGAYRTLARMRIAALHETRKDPAAAVASYDAVAADPATPEAVADMAAVRAAYVLVDSGSLADVRQRVELLSADSEPLRHPAREALALASWKAGETANAGALFQQLLDDASTPSGIASRARLMLDVIGAAAPAPAATVASDAPPPGVLEVSPASPADPAATVETTAPAAAQAPAPLPSPAGGQAAPVFEPAPAPAPPATQSQN